MRKTIVIMVLLLALTLIPSFATGIISGTTMTISSTTTQQDFDSLDDNKLKNVEELIGFSNNGFLIKNWSKIYSADKLSWIELIFNNGRLSDQKFNFILEQKMPNLMGLVLEGIDRFDFNMLTKLKDGNKEVLSIRANEFVNFNALKGNYFNAAIALLVNNFSENEGGTSTDHLAANFVITKEHLDQIGTKKIARKITIEPSSILDVRKYKHLADEIYINFIQTKFELEKPYKFKKLLYLDSNLKKEQILTGYSAEDKAKNTLDYETIDVTYDKNHVKYLGNGQWQLISDKATLYPRVAEEHMGRVVLQKKKEKYKIYRIWGPTRFSTATEVSKKLNTNSGTVILANSQRYPDVLTSTVLAKQLNAPILLAGIDKLSKETKAELARLKAKKLILIGANGVISDKLEAELKKTYQIERLGGATRYQSAELVANKINSSKGVILARGDDFPDALTMSAIALKNNYPIYLTEPKEILDSTLEKIKNRKPEIIYIAGGELAVSKETELKLSKIAKVKRIAGKNSFQTAIQIAEYVYGPNVNTMLFARSDDFTDAMVAGPLAYKLQAPIMLVSQSKVPQEVKTYLGIRRGIKPAYIIGGTIAVSKFIENELVKLLE